MDEQDLPACLLTTFRSGETPVMIWGCIPYGANRPMKILLEDSMTGTKYVECIVRPILHAFDKEQYKEVGNAIVIEDGVPSHKANTFKVLQTNGKFKAYLVLFNHWTPILLKISGALWRTESTTERFLWALKRHSKRHCRKNGTDLCQGTLISLY